MISVKFDLSINVEPNSDGYSTVEVTDTAGHVYHRTLCKTGDIPENISAAVYRITDRNIAMVGT